MRPNVHIRDLTRFYRLLLTAPRERVNGRAFNVSRDNATVRALAEMVRAEIDPALPIDVVPSRDDRSYHLSAERARRELGFEPREPLRRAVQELREAFRDGRVADPRDPVYRNLETMQRDSDLWLRLLATPERAPSRT
jgi:nucleoside-diphosphate-sugar epimerase